jgi:ABC-type antimicrobial peptide transport system permease subunit
MSDTTPDRRLRQRPVERDSQADTQPRRDILDNETFQAAGEVTRQPGVASVAIVYPVPYGPGAGSGIYIKVPNQASEIFVQRYLVRGDLPKTLGMSLLSGRWFDGEDENNGADVVVISELLSKRYFSGQPIGARIWVDGERGPRAIVGVVDNIVAGFGEKLEPAMYIPITPKVGSEDTRYAVVARMSLGGLAPPNNVPASNNLLQFDGWSNLAEMIADAGTTDRASALIAGWFAALALLLAAASAYAVFWTLTMQRQREMAVRICFGALPSNLALRMLANGLELAVFAGVGGLFVYLGLQRILSSHIYGFPLFSWASFMISFGIVSFATVLSVVAPANSILRLSPSELLREN